MAYFETLGQLQSNDETFVPIYSNILKATNKTNISGNTFGFTIGDILLIHSILIINNRSFVFSNLDIIGSDVLFQSVVSPNGFNITNDFGGGGFVAICRVKSDNISISFNDVGTPTQSGKIMILKLLPN